MVVNTSPIIQAREKRSKSSKRYPITFDLNSILIKDGWDFIEDIIWLKPESSVKNRNGGFFQHKKPLAYKPNIRNEYVMVYRKSTEKLIDWNIQQYDKDIVEKSKIKEYESSNIWEIRPVSDKNHPAVFPKELCRRVISYYSMIGDLVCDPFAGIGTVGVVCKELNREFIGIEQNKEYFEIAKTKLT